MERENEYCVSIPVSPFLYLIRMFYLAEETSQLGENKTPRNFLFSILCAGIYERGKTGAFAAYCISKHVHIHA